MGKIIKTINKILSDIEWKLSLWQILKSFGFGSMLSYISPITNQLGYPVTIFILSCFVLWFFRLIQNNINKIETNTSQNEKSSLEFINLEKLKKEFPETSLIIKLEKNEFSDIVYNLKEVKNIIPCDTKTHKIKEMKNTNSRAKAIYVISFIFEFKININSFNRKIDGIIQAGDSKIFRAIKVIPFSNCIYIEMEGDLDFKHGLYKIQFLES